MGIPPGAQRGQILVMFAITAASLLAVIGLLFSFGLVLAQRRTMQTAADAAALAGAWRVLAEMQSDNRSDTAVYNSIVQFASSNGVAGASSVAAVYVDAASNSLGTVGSGGVFPLSTRGVQVTMSGQVSTILPAFLRTWQVLVQSNASGALRQADPPTSATLVVPLTVSLTDFQAAYPQHHVYDLFQPAHPPLSRPPTLDFLGTGTNPAIGATSYGPLAASLQYWSDGQHTNGTLRTNGAIALAGGTYFDSISAGLRDNVRRQALVDSSSANYALVLVPVWDTADSGTGTVHVTGFAQMKLRAADITATNARGVFVPFSVSAAVTTTQPSGADLGAALVQIVS